jgi:hypothetical protein
MAIWKGSSVNSWSNRAMSNWEHCLYMTYCNILKYADMLDAVGCFAVSCWVFINQYHMWLWHAHLYMTAM